MKTIVGLYDDVSVARQVIEELVRAGFDRDDINLVANNRTTSMTTGDAAMEGEAAADGAVSGAVTGGVLGGLGGILLGLGALAIPGIGPVVAAGPIVAGLTGAGIGAAVGGLVGALIGWGIPQDEAEFYAEGVRRGSTLVAVKAEEGEVDSALTIMNRFGPVDVRQRSEQWRSEGWTGFDTEATPYVAPAAATKVNVGTTDTARTVAAGQEMKIPIVEEELRVGKREVEQGGVRIHTYMEEKPVTEQVTLREESVYVERHPVDRPADGSAFDAFQDRTYEVRQKAEQIVTDKQAHVVEEVVVGKQVDTHVETVEDTLRRTRVNVEQMGASDNIARFRTHYNRFYGNGGANAQTFDYYQPAYTYGSTLANDSRYQGREWNTIEADIRRDWESRGQGAWEEFKDAIRFAWNDFKQAVN